MCQGNKNKCRSRRCGKRCNVGCKTRCGAEVKVDVPCDIKVPLPAVRVCLPTKVDVPVRVSEKLRIDAPVCLNERFDVKVDIPFSFEECIDVNIPVGFSNKLDVSVDLCDDDKKKVACGPKRCKKTKRCFRKKKACASGKEDFFDSDDEFDFDDESADFDWESEVGDCQSGDICDSDLDDGSDDEFDEDCSDDEKTEELCDDEDEGWGSDDGEFDFGWNKKSKKGKRCSFKENEKDCCDSDIFRKNLRILGKENALFDRWGRVYCKWERACKKDRISPCKKDKLNKTHRTLCAGFRKLGNRVPAHRRKEYDQACSFLRGFRF